MSVKGLPSALYTTVYIPAVNLIDCDLFDESAYFRFANIPQGKNVIFIGMVSKFEAFPRLGFYSCRDVNKGVWHFGAHGGAVDLLNWKEHFSEIMSWDWGITVMEMIIRFSYGWPCPSSVIYLYINVLRPLLCWGVHGPVRFPSAIHIVSLSNANDMLIIISFTKSFIFIYTTAKIPTKSANSVSRNQVYLYFR